MLALAGVLFFCLPFAAPLLVFQSRRHRPFIRHYAAQAANLSISVLVYYGIIKSFLPDGVGLWLILMAGFFLVKALLAANSGDWYRIPRAMAWPMFK
jgi:uncharacterized Tic20 family protein